MAALRAAVVYPAGRPAGPEALLLFCRFIFIILLLFFWRLWVLVPRPHHCRPLGASPRWERNALLLFFWSFFSILLLFFWRLWPSFLWPLLPRPRRVRWPAAGRKPTSSCWWCPPAGLDAGISVGDS